jgi:hypothetical protein
MIPDWYGWLQVSLTSYTNRDQPRLTFIISICISLIVALNCGSWTNWLLTFIISVDFWKAPVTLTIAIRVRTPVNFPVTNAQYNRIILTCLMLHLHLYAPQPSLAHRQPVLLLVRAYDLFGEQPGRLDVVLLGKLLQGLSSLCCCQIEL